MFTGEQVLSFFSIPQLRRLANIFLTELPLLFPFPLIPANNITYDKRIIIFTLIQQECKRPFFFKLIQTVVFDKQISHTRSKRDLPACVPGKDSYQPAHLLNLITAFRATIFLKIVFFQAIVEGLFLKSRGSADASYGHCRL